MESAPQPDAITRCRMSYWRDFTIENANFAHERAEKPGVAPMHLRAFDGCGAILRRRVKFDDKRRPVMRLYKMIDMEGVSEMMESGVVPQMIDDKLDCVVTYTDLNLNEAIKKYYDDDESTYELYIIDYISLLSEGWTPMYDRRCVYWYPPIAIQYVHGAPEFSDSHLSEQCIDY
jgi:hypothetical protein